jgi:hypothetical protein
MEAELDPGLPLWRRHHRSHQPTMEDRLIARILAPWLDRELAEPGGPALSQAHAARAVQLTSERARTSLARRLDKLIERAEPDEIPDAAPLIASLAARLRSKDVVDARGVARLKTLVSEQASRSRRNALAAALHEASELLEVSRRVNQPAS